MSDLVNQIESQLRDPRVSVRLHAIGQIAAKVGGHVELNHTTPI